MLSQDQLASYTKYEEVFVAAVEVEVEGRTVLTDAFSGLPVTFEANNEASEKDNTVKTVGRCIFNK